MIDSANILFDDSKNDLRALPKTVRLQILLVLSFIWSVVFSLYIFSYTTFIFGWAGVFLAHAGIIFVPTPVIYFNKLLLAVASVLLVGLGTGFYLIANLGPGPRDGLMTGLQRKTNLPIASVRAFLEISVVSIGWYLGGTVGIGTLLFAFGIGPAVALGLYLVGKFFN